MEPDFWGNSEFFTFLKSTVQGKTRYFCVYSFDFGFFSLYLEMYIRNSAPIYAHKAL